MNSLFIILLPILFYTFVTGANADTKSSTVIIPTGNQSTESTSVTTTITTSNAPSPEDQAIITATYEKFNKSSALIGTSLTVTSENRVVTISGTVTAQSQADAAIEAATAIVGKGNVRSNIKVTTNPDFNKQPTVTPNY